MHLSACNFKARQFPNAFSFLKSKKLCKQNVHKEDISTNRLYIVWLLQRQHKHKKVLQTFYFRFFSSYFPRGNVLSSLGAIKWGFLCCKHDRCSSHLGVDNFFPWACLLLKWILNNRKNTKSIFHFGFRVWVIKFNFLKYTLNI